MLQFGKTCLFPCYRVATLTAICSFCFYFTSKSQTEGRIRDRIDYQKLVSRADLVYDKPVTRSEDGMPFGNGVMGSLVWTTPSAIHLQINRVDVFGNNASSDNFFERHTDYCGGLGYVDLDFIEKLFEGNDFQQHLSCYNGIVSVQTRDITAQLLAWQTQDVMAFHIKDNRSEWHPSVMKVRALRLPDTRKGDHRALSSLKVIGDEVALVQAFTENTFYCGSVMIIKVTDAKIHAGIENAMEGRITTENRARQFTVWVASAASFDRNEDLIKTAQSKLDMAMQSGFTKVSEDNQTWWRQFWKRSFIQLHSNDQVGDELEKYYTYYKYLMASSSRGKYPTKFNGMLWNTGGDERKWGNLFWGANQSCLYNALFQMNNMDLLDPMFNMYSNAFENFASAAKLQWGSSGIFIPETVAFDGLGELPPDIADEMRELYLLKKAWPDRSAQFTSFAYTKMPFLSRWNWKKDDGWKDGKWMTSDKGGGPYGHVTHIFSRGAKIVYQYWLRYEYTHDVDWLRDRAYPMIKGVAEFYRNFPGLKKEQDGKYHIRNVNDNESIWGGHNTVEEISAMMGILPVAIKSSVILKADPELRAQWKELLEHMSPLPMSSDYSKQEPLTWMRSLTPVVHGEPNRSPDPNTMPVWFFDLCTLEADAQTLKIAQATFDSYFPNGISEKTSVNVLSKLPVTGSLLGRVESTQFLIPNQINTGETEILRNRMDLREGNQTTSAQRLGRAADALQNAMCQSVPPKPGEETVIHIFPAWPKHWDAQYTLLCRGAFLVSSEFRNGAITGVEIESQAGNTCTLRNPWPGQAVSLYRNGKFWKKTTSTRITFPTVKNDIITLTPHKRG